MFCRKCGTEFRLNAKFCAKCGAPVPKAAAAAPAEEVKPLLNREDAPRPVVHVPPVVPEAEPVSASKPETAPEPAPTLISTMPETKSSSSNGQFDEWFSEAGDL